MNLLDESLKKNKKKTLRHVYIISTSLLLKLSLIFKDDDILLKKKVT